MQVGTLLFTVVVLTVHLELASVLEHWTWLHFFGIAFSICAAQCKAECLTSYFFVCQQAAQGQSVDTFS